MNFKLTALLCAFCGAALVLWVTFPAGLGYTYDSYRYLYAGESLYHQGILTQPGGKPFVEWPPLLPLLLAGLHLFTNDLTTITVYFQALLFFSVIWLSSQLISIYIQHPWLRLASLLSITLGTPLVLVYTFLWSEALFILFILLAIYLLLSYQQKPKPMYLGWLVFLGMALPMQRLIGIGLVMLIALLLFVSKKPYRKQAKVTLAFSGLAFTPILAWMIRNHWVAGKMIAQHLSPPYTWLQNLERIHEVITAWWLPDELPLALRMGISYSLLISVFYLLRNQLYSYKDWVLAGLFVGYIVGLVLLASIFFFEPIDERLLAPAFIPANLLLLSLLDKLLVTKYVSNYKNVLVCVCVLLLAYPLARTFKNSYDWRSRPPASTTQFHNYFN